jgi:hypothetical protein
VQPDEVRRPRYALGQLADRQRGGVGREQRPVRQHRLDLREYLGLDGGVLEDGLDHEVGALRVPGVRRGRDAGEQLVALLLGGATLLDRLGHELLRVALALIGRLPRDILEHHLDAGLGTHVGDRGAHHAGAEHHDLRRLEAFYALRPAAVAVHRLHVEEERLDHVLRHLARDQVDEVAALDLDRVVEVHLRALHRRREDVVRRRVVGSLDLLAQVGGERRQVDGELGVGRRSARDLVALLVPGLDGLRVVSDPLLGRGHELLAARHDLVDDAELLGLRDAQPLALEQHLHQRFHDAEHAHGAHHAAGAWEQAELHLGEAEPHGVVVERDAVVRGEGDL